MVYIFSGGINIVKLFPMKVKALLALPFLSSTVIGNVPEFVV